MVEIRPLTPSGLHLSGLYFIPPDQMHSGYNTMAFICRRSAPRLLRGFIKHGARHGAASLGPLPRHPVSGHLAACQRGNIIIGRGGSTPRLMHHLRHVGPFTHRRF